MGCLGVMRLGGAEAGWSALGRVGPEGRDVINSGGGLGWVGLGWVGQLLSLFAEAAVVVAIVGGKEGEGASLALIS